MNVPAIKMSLESSVEFSGLVKETQSPEVANTASSCAWTVLLSGTVTLPGNQTFITLYLDGQTLPKSVLPVLNQNFKSPELLL